MTLQSIAQQAKRSPEMVCNTVLHVIDQEFLREAYRQTRKTSAPGVEKVTAKQYAENLEATLRDLHERLRDNRYVAPPVERVWIEKEDGKQRPISKPCFEDKMVQRAVVMILEASFEHDFHACSHGFRKGHSPHQALHELREQCRKLHIPWRVDADVRGCFDNLDWGRLRECIQQRVNDGGILRLIGKWLHAGVLEAGELTHPDKGAPQGGVSSPMVSNLCLHQVLDAWFVKDVQPRLKGRCFLTRFADECILGVELEADARRVMEVVPKRFNRFNLTLPPAKTVLIAFKQPPCQEQSATGKGTFDFLGLTHSWAKTRRGDWVIKRKTTGKRLRRCMKAIWTWCRDNRHEPWQEQYRMLGSQRRGSYQYYGIRGNFKRLEVVFEHTERAWQYWLSRRSHKGHINWQQYEDAVRHQLPLPKPRIMHNISQRQGQQRDAPHGVSPVWFAIGDSFWLPRNRMRETFTSGSVGRALGNRCLYPEADAFQRPLRSRFQARLSRSVDMICIASTCARRHAFWRKRCVNHHYFVICTQGKS
jgi:RNA-directed DNA polymerase